MTTTKKIIIITAPSGAGKTSIVQYLLNKYEQLAFSISVTTRQPRRAEVNGKDYYFITKEAFLAKRNANAFVEWEMVYEGKYYGTLHSELEKIWNNCKIPVLDIDVKGAMHVQQKYPKQSFLIFVEPPSIEVLKTRLHNRGTDSLESIETRLKKAEQELAYKNQFNKVIINDELARACSETSNEIDAFLN